eukprot:02579.XXX_70507_70608_1 [CDS] Oithona nana genome sequencing.
MFIFVFMFIDKMVIHVTVTIVTVVTNVTDKQLV